MSTIERPANSVEGLAVEDTWQTFHTVHDRPSGLTYFDMIKQMRQNFPPAHSTARDGMILRRQTEDGHDLYYAEVLLRRGRGADAFAVRGNPDYGYEADYEGQFRDGKKIDARIGDSITTFRLTHAHEHITQMQSNPLHEMARAAIMAMQERQDDRHSIWQLFSHR